MFAESLFAFGKCQTLSPKCHDTPVSSTTTMAPSPPPPPPKSARELRASNRSAGVLAIASKPKSTSRKRQQSNADESASKRNKTAATSEGDGAEDSAIDVEEAFDVQREGKGGKKAKKTGGRAKKTYLFYFLNIHSLF